MRLFVIALVMIAVGGVGLAQEDDDWNEIQGLMNGLTGANQRLFDLGVQNVGGTAGLTPGFLQGLAQWSQTYARVLQSVEGAFDVDGVQPGAYDPFDLNAPNLLWEEFDRWQARMQNKPQPQTYRNYRQVPQYYRGYR